MTFFQKIPGLTECYLIGGFLSEYYTMSISVYGMEVYVGGGRMYAMQNFALFHPDYDMVSSGMVPSSA